MALKFGVPAGSVAGDGHFSLTGDPNGAAPVAQAIAEWIQSKGARIFTLGLHIFGDAMIWVTQTRLLTPFTDRLATVLRQTPRTSLRHILADQHGRALNYDQVQKKVMAVREKADLKEYSLHGLRYSAASELAEAGCTDQQIGAITGHKSLSMIHKYSKGASQKRLAKEAQNLRERNKNGS